MPVDIHGGLSYGNFPEINIDLGGEAVALPGVDRTHTLGWIGFDTGHYGDQWTPEELERVGVARKVIDYAIERNFFLNYSSATLTCWTLDDLITETRRLADQVGGATDTPLLL